MRRNRPPEVKLFAHYSILRPETYAKVGHFVCGTPPHITFAGIITRQPEVVMDALRDTLSGQMELPHMERAQMALSYGHYRIRPIVKLHDTAQRLAQLQDRVLDTVAPMDDTYIAPRTRFVDGRCPHVTIDQLVCHPQLPMEFDIDHIMVTSGSKAGPSHWHNHVWDIIYLDQAKQEAAA